MASTIVVITGGRAQLVEDRNSLLAYLRSVNCCAVYHGNCTGIDQDVKRIVNGIYGTKAFIPNWEEYGRRAGPLRNRIMLQSAINTGIRVVLIAFPGGVGTQNCIEHATKLGIEIHHLR